MALSFNTAAQAADDAVVSKAREIEGRLQARVGVAIVDTGSGKSWSYKADERFPMASTFKVLACGALLQKADKGELKLRDTVTIKKADMVPYAPVTEKLIGAKISLGDLCAATMRTSDNVAANKVLEAIGGPEAVTAFLRDTNDQITRLDRNEPELNEGKPGDEKDTTTPAAMADTLRKLVLGDALSSGSRKQLTTWLVENEVGGPLLRAGLPKSWRIGDRTGAGGYGTRGVVAVIWPPKHEPIVAAIYITQTKATMDERNAAIAELGKVIASAIAE
ncbi:class A beta-lactamase [Tianweitania sp. BSSL-BM11]|uniref:Beta-lactamase n=2 Tax=Tianweitania aestuarii TaxID=2814886 RepID=A0ABS5RUJ4_9HYPH|nr:class A beta-lactamase [Tianweitania aestuarii]